MAMPGIRMEKTLKGPQRANTPAEKRKGMA